MVLSTIFNKCKEFFKKKKEKKKKILVLQIIIVLLIKLKNLDLMELINAFTIYSKRKTKILTLNL